MQTLPQTPFKRQTATSNVMETPRRRKSTTHTRLVGIRTHLPNNLSLEAIPMRMKAGLRISYDLDDWQVHLIRRILQGYDSILCAGTGYGKSIIFEGLAYLGSKGKLVIVISPLKALKHDQVCHQLFIIYMYSSNVCCRCCKCPRKVSRLSCSTRIHLTLLNHGYKYEQPPSWCTCPRKWCSLPASSGFGSRARHG